jgi:signal transduction histidine kinase
VKVFCGSVGRSHPPNRDGVRQPEPLAPDASGFDYRYRQPWGTLPSAKRRRELAHGIHPAVLADRGLEPALEGLATHSHLPVELTTHVAQRLPAPVEAAVYYVAAEGLTNIAKYAQASAAEVRLEEADGGVVLRISDNGAGGANPERGTGLRGLADRVEALGGRLELDSRPGHGTLLTARIPCDSRFSRRSRAI